MFIGAQSSRRLGVSATRMRSLSSAIQMQKPKVASPRVWPSPLFASRTITRCVNNNMIDGGTGSGGGGGDIMSDDLGSNLTELTLDDENYISLLQYRDAHHILNLPKPSSSYVSTTAPNDIQKAYDIAKEQVELDLHQFELKHRQQQQQQPRSNNLFFVSQMNYLELKLQALDQAYDELMPSPQQEEGYNDLSKEGEESIGILLGEGIESHDASELSVADKEEEEEPFTPKVLKRDYVWGDTTDNLANQQQQANLQLQTHKRNLSEDELCRSIDIYFRPNTPAPTQPSDMSTCTWDGSSLFSIISGSKNNNGTLDCTRPLSDPGTGKKECRGDDAGALPSSTNRPTAIGTIDVRHTRSKKSPPKAQISPTSVTDYPATIHGHNHYEDTTTSSNSSSSKKNQNIKSGSSSTRRGKGDRGKIINALPHESIEAARMGILRALSEENSECIPLDDDEYERYCNDYKTPTIKKNATVKTMITTTRTKTNASSDLNEKIHDPIVGKQQQQQLSSSSQDTFQLWGSKSDSMPKDSNSLIKGSACDSIEKNNMTRQKSWTEKVTSFDNSNASATVMSQRKKEQNRSKSTSPLPTQSSRNQINLHPKTSNEQQLRPSTNNDFDDILQVGMELADELCMMVNNCWKGNDIILGSPIGSPSRVVSSYNHRIIAQPEEESTLYSATHHDDLNTLNTTHDESTYMTQRSANESTDGESTAFNTDSSFDHRQHHGNSQKKN